MALGSFLLVFILLGLNPVYLQGQTCCSGGVPVSGNLGLPPASGQTLQLSLLYDLNVLETLKAGRQVLDDNSRSRKTHSAILQMGYSFTERFAVDAFFSWVRQERVISQFGNENSTFTQGVGDAVVLIKYKLLALNDNYTTLTGGLGVKLPTGQADLTDDRGITLNADLQPGSGALDGILWAQFSQVLDFRPSMSLTLTSTYSYKGKNNDYLGSQVYQFGQELLLQAGIADRLTIGKSLFDPTLNFIYRHARPDENNGEDLPSTGGQWIFFNPGVSYWISTDLSFNANVNIPLVADITGTQVTPTYRVNFGFFYRIGLGKEQDMIDPVQSKGVF